MELITLIAVVMNHLLHWRTKCSEIDKSFVTEMIHHATSLFNFRTPGVSAGTYCALLLRVLKSSKWCFVNKIFFPPFRNEFVYSWRF